MVSRGNCPGMPDSSGRNKSSPDHITRRELPTQKEATKSDAQESYHTIRATEELSDHHAKKLPHEKAIGNPEHTKKLPTGYTRKATEGLYYPVIPYSP